MQREGRQKVVVYVSQQRRSGPWGDVVIIGVESAGMF
jgi:hypothetical protein